MLPLIEYSIDFFLHLYISPSGQTLTCTDNHRATISRGSRFPAPTPKIKHGLLVIEDAATASSRNNNRLGIEFDSRLNFVFSVPGDTLWVESTSECFFLLLPATLSSKVNV